MELPERYNEDTLVAMVRDTGWVFAYWEVSEKTGRQIQEKFGAELHGSQIVLRVFEISANGESRLMFDVPVGTLLGSWYLQLQSQAVQFHLELGYLTPQGRFIELLRSHPVSGGFDFEWMAADQEALLRRFSEELASESFLRL